MGCIYKVKANVGGVIDREAFFITPFFGNIAGAIRPTPRKLYKEPAFLPAYYGPY